MTMSSGIKWDENRAWSDPDNDEPHLAKDADPSLRAVETDRRAAGRAVELQRRRHRPARQHRRARFRQALRRLRARGAVRTARHRRLRAGEQSENGKIAAAAGLRLRPRDAAKLGQLVLDRGAWGGRPIVSAGWIAQSVRPRFQTIGYFGGLFFYGYHWWLGRSLSGEQEVSWIAAQGLGGQRIFIVPSLDLVVMTTSGFIRARARATHRSTFSAILSFRRRATRKRAVIQPARKAP